jgi:hypothetical protein
MGMGFQLPPGAPESTVCPGYSTSLPEVFEAGRALCWRKDSQLRELYDQRITPRLRDAMDIFNLEIRRVERHEMSMIRQKQKQEEQRRGCR